MSASGPDCVKNAGKIVEQKNGRSERPVRDFLEVGREHPKPENFKFVRSYTAWVESGRMQAQSAR